MSLVNSIWVLLHEPNFFSFLKKAIHSDHWSQVHHHILKIVCFVILPCFFIHRICIFAILKVFLVLQMSVFFVSVVHSVLIILLNPLESCFFSFNFIIYDLSY